MVDNSGPDVEGGTEGLNTTLEGVRPDELASGWLAAIIESADDAIISKTLDGIITSWNGAAQRIFGYSAEEIVGKPILTLIPAELHSEEDVILANIRAGRRVEHYETIRRRKDGKLIDVSLTISPIKTSDGRIVGASKIAREITHRKLAEARLKEQTETLETINRIGRLLSAELDQDKLVQSLTDAATELTGAEFGAFFYNVIDNKGESYMLYTLSGIPREAFENFPMPRATGLFGPTFRGEGTIRLDNVREDPRYGKNPPYKGMPEGHLPVKSYLAVPVVSRSGEVIGGLFFGHSKPAMFTERHERIMEGLAAQTAVAMDNARLWERAQNAIRDREELLEREQAARHDAEVASRSKDEFLGMLSHELRTPLNAILGWTRLLTRGHLDESSARDALDAIDRNASLQSRLIEDMLDVSRIMSGKMRLDAQAVDPTVVINAAVDTLRPAADAKDIRISTTLSFGSGAVLGDPVRLQQVVWNLLSNAIKFTPRGGRVTVSLHKIDNQFEITVSDNGPGIDEEFLPYVFERFRQGDSSTTKRFGGLGLGLTIARQLVEMQGGTIEASNLESGGAQFVVKLPELGYARTPSVERATDSSPLDVSSLVEYPAELRGVKVLAVDDDDDSRELLETMLRQSGSEVVTCSSVEAALDALKGFSPDVIVSDIGMPGEDGYSLIRKIREAENACAGTPAIALTAFARSEDRMRALAAGFNMHVPKPVEPAELLMVISSLIRHERQSRPHA
ncbi:MAG: ATP-binding protein [Pyrinomonadaceae bacterium]